MDDDLDHGLEGYHLEVKRRERYELDEWLRQAEEDAGERIPVVVFRKSKQPWRAVIDFDQLVRLITNHQGEVRSGKNGNPEG